MNCNSDGCMRHCAMAADLSGGGSTPGVMLLFWVLAPGSTLDTCDTANYPANPMDSSSWAASCVQGSGYLVGAAVGRSGDCSGGGGGGGGSCKTKSLPPCCAAVWVSLVHDHGVVRAVFCDQVRTPLPALPRAPALSPCATLARARSSPRRCRLCAAATRSPPATPRGLASLLSVRHACHAPPTMRSAQQRCDSPVGCVSVGLRSSACLVEPGRQHGVPRVHFRRECRHWRPLLPRQRRHARRVRAARSPLFPSLLPLLPLLPVAGSGPECG